MTTINSNMDKCFKLSINDDLKGVSFTLFNNKDNVNIVDSDFTYDELIHHLFVDIFNYYSISVFPEHVILDVKGLDVKLYFSITENHLVFSESNQGITHIRIRYGKEYDIDKLKLSMGTFIDNVYNKTKKKLRLINKIKDVNSSLESEGISFGIILKSKNSMKFYLKKGEVTFMYFEVDNNFNLLEVEYEIDEITDKEKVYLENLIESSLKKFQLV